MKKLYVIRKYIKANSALEAIRKEKGVKPDGVWIDDEWMKANIETLEGGNEKKGIGFDKKKSILKPLTS